MPNSVGPAASNVLRARRVSDNKISKGSASSIVIDEKVHALVSSIGVCAGKEVALLAADT